MIDWNQYPTTGGITGQSSVDPSQLQVQPGSGITFDPLQASPSSPMAGGGGITGGSYPGSDNDPLGVNYSNWLRQKQGLPPMTAEQWGWAPQSGGQQWDQNYFTQNFGTPRTPQELVALESKITAAGGKVLRNASGVAGKIQTPDGRIIDVINSAGAGGNGFQWLDGGGGSGGAGGGMGTLNGIASGAFIAPFVPPSAQDALNSPGTQYALDEASRMMQNSAAAKGTLLNGRTLQAENAATLNNANTLYGDVFNRAYQTFTRNQDAPFNKFSTLASLGQKAAGES